MEFLRQTSMKVCVYAKRSQNESSGLCTSSNKRKSAANSDIVCWQCGRSNIFIYLFYLIIFFFIYLQSELYSSKSDQLLDFFDRTNSEGRNLTAKSQHLFL